MSEVTLPLARVKRLMKTDPDVKMVSSEAVALVAKATEVFLAHLAKESVHKTTESGRKTIQYKDLVTALLEVESFDFLQEVLRE